MKPGGNSHGLVRYGNTELMVLPSVHCQIEFAAAALNADLAQFDRILVELPATLPVYPVLGLLERMRGAPGAILVARGEAILAKVPESPDDPARREMPLFQSGMLPITHDSIVTTLRWAARNERGDAVRFVDLPAEWNSGPAESFSEQLAPFDSAEVTDLGVAGWYERHACWLAAMPHTKRFLLREAHMAWMVRETLLEIPDGRILFVCGALHWERIRDRLDRNDFPDFTTRTLPMLSPETLFAYTLSPVTLYSWQLADLPWLAWRFAREFQGQHPSFDRVKLGDALLRTTCQRHPSSLTPRNLLLLEMLLARMLRGEGRQSWHFDRHLLPAARAAAGTAFAECLEAHAMRHPMPKTRNVPEARVVPAGGDEYFIVGPHEAHIIRMPAASTTSSSGSRTLRIGRSRRLTMRESLRMHALTLDRMKCPAEERLNKFMCDHARWQGHNLLARRHDFRRRPFRGSLHAGIDYKRTIAASARGDETLFVRQRMRSNASHSGCDSCPVVWVFDARAPVQVRMGDFFQESVIGHLYTSFFWFTGQTQRHRVRRHDIAWYVRIQKNITPSWDRSLVDRELLDHLPAGRRCKVEPWDDKELNARFSGPDLAIACAIKWSFAGHITLVNCDASFRPGQDVLGYAESKGVQVLSPSIENFDPILLERLKLDHDVPIKTSWSAPDALFLRYVSPVPGFDTPVGMIPQQPQSEVP